MTDVVIQFARTTVTKQKYRLYKHTICFRVLNFVFHCVYFYRLFEINKILFYDNDNDNNNNDSNNNNK